MKSALFCTTSLVAWCVGLGAWSHDIRAQTRASDEIGVTTATNPATRGTPLQRPTRVLHIGTNVTSRERVQSTGSGSAQLLFVDRSNITIGPNSDLVLDEFVYNPANNTGRVAATLTRGVMRFIGGQISHQGNVSITTPTATIGVRGGAVLLRVDQAGATEVKVNYGQASIVSRTTGESQRVMRPNFGVTISAGGVVSAPVRFSADDLIQITSQLHSAPDQSGGALERPTDERAQSAGVGRANANVLARSNARSGLLDDLQVDPRSIINGQLNTNRTVVVTVVTPTSPPPPAMSPPPPVVVLPPPPPPVVVPPPPPPSTEGPPPPPPVVVLPPPPPPPSEEGSRSPRWHMHVHHVDRQRWSPAPSSATESRSFALPQRAPALPNPVATIAPPSGAIGAIPATMRIPAAPFIAAPSALTAPRRELAAPFADGPSARGPRGLQRELGPRPLAPPGAHGPGMHLPLRRP